MRYAHGDWSERELDILRKRHAAGDSFGQIAQRLPGRTRSACVGKANRLGLKRTTPSRPVRRAPKSSDPKRRALGSPACLDGCCTHGDILADDRDLEICARISKGEALTSISQAFPEVGVLHVSDLKAAIEAAQ